MLTDKQKEEVKCEHFKSLHDSNKSVRLDKVGFVTDHSGGGGGGTTHPAVVSPARQHDDM